LTVFVIATSMHAGTAFSASDSVTSTSIGRFALEAFDLPLQERVDLCSTLYPKLKPAITTATAELRGRYMSLLTQELETERFATLLKAEVPLGLFALYRGQSAMRRQVNTRITQQRCESAISEYAGASDQVLSSTIRVLLTSVKSRIDADKEQGAK
jgi:hypothetical protein